MGSVGAGVGLATPSGFMVFVYTEEKDKDVGSGEMTVVMGDAEVEAGHGISRGEQNMLFFACWVWRDESTVCCLIESRTQLSNKRMWYVFSYGSQPYGGEEDEIAVY